MSPVRLEHPPSILRRMFGSSHAPVPWGKYGLLAHRFQTADAGEARFASLPRPNRFRLALEEAGGLYVWFGQFLSGRVDLLPSTYTSQLRHLRAPKGSGETPPSSVPELAGRFTEAELLRVTPASEVYAATGPDGPVVLEIFGSREAGERRSQGNGGRVRVPFSEPDWASFSRQMRLLIDSEESSAVQPPVLERFREWLLLHADMERKRVILRNLQDIPIRCVSRFPRLLADVPSVRCLAYERMEGLPLVAAGGAFASESGLHLWAEGLLEQSLLLSLVDAEAQPENYLVLPEGGLGFRTLPALVSVPVEWHYELLQYVASASASNTARALQMLSRMSGSGSPYGTEQLLFEKLSSLQPELKINVVAPESVAALENYWRAMARTEQRLPAFLDYFHRNLSVLGQSSETAGLSSDVVSDAMWPALGRVLQFRIGDILSTERGQDWLASSGLLMMSAVRQLTVSLEQVRDNDLALILDRQESEAANGSGNRRIASVVGSGVSLVSFLFFLQLVSRSSGGAPSLLALLAAIGSAVALSMFVSRIE